MPCDDPGYVSGQYRDAANPGVRVTLHGRPDDGYPKACRGFGLENGEKQLSRLFSSVRLARREDPLSVTEVRPLLDYLRSGAAVRAAKGEGKITALAEGLGRESASRWVIRVTKDTGMFVARR